MLEGGGGGGRQVLGLEGVVLAHLLGHLLRHDLGLQGDEGLANLSGLLPALLRGTDMRAHNSDPEFMNKKTKSIGFLHFSRSGLHRSSYGYEHAA